MTTSKAGRTRGIIILNYKSYYAEDLDSWSCDISSTKFLQVSTLWLVSTLSEVKLHPGTCIFWTQKCPIQVHMKNFCPQRTPLLKDTEPEHQSQQPMPCKAVHMLQLKLQPQDRNKETLWKHNWRPLQFILNINHSTFSLNILRISFLLILSYILCHLNKLLI